MDDYGAGQGSKKGTALKIVGVGCGVVFLIAAGLMAFGVFRAATCCSDFAELEFVMADALEQSYEFGQALHTGDVDVAYEQFGADQEWTRAELGALYDRNRGYFEASRPFPPSIEMEQVDEGMRPDFNLWRSRLEYRAPDADEVFRLSLVWRADKTGSEEEEGYTLSLLRWESQVAQQGVEQARGAETARRFYYLLRDQNWTGLRPLLDEAGELAEETWEDTESNLRDLRGELIRGDLKVVAVHPVSVYFLSVDLEIAGVEENQLISVLVHPLSSRVIDARTAPPTPHAVQDGDEGGEGEEDGREEEGEEEASDDAEDPAQ